MWVQVSFVQRFTPTGVGTIDSSSSCLILSDGSPPRAWGQLIYLLCLTFQTSVHPHGRGDNLIIIPIRRFVRRFTPTGVGTMGYPQCAL